MWSIIWESTDGNLSYLCFWTTSYWFQRRLNLKILKRDFQLSTIMGVQSNISLSSCLVVVVCITSFRLVLVHSESLRILVQPKDLNICLAMKIHIMARLGKETKQLYFQFTSYINLLDVFHLYSRVLNNRTSYRHHYLICTKIFPVQC